MTRKDGQRIAGFLLVLFALVTGYQYTTAKSADLLAVWLAGVQFDAGAWESIYPRDTDFFHMFPPREWYDLMAERYGYDGSIYPYLYPPLWAWAASFAAGSDFFTLATGASLANAALLAGALFLGLRTSGLWQEAAPRQLVIATVTSISALLLTQISHPAMIQNQPQILVSFLVLLAADRLRAGGPVAAGIALALAAALKALPAFYAVLFIARRQWRALAAFTGAGLALGLLSITVAGWPLHEIFLEQTGLISRTVILTGITFNIDAAVAQLFHLSELTLLQPLDATTGMGQRQGWYAMARPEAWVWISRALMAGTVALLFWLFRRFGGDRQYAGPLWAIAFTAVPLVIPLSWSYYYIPTAALLPALFPALGTRNACLIAMVGIGLQTPYVYQYFLPFTSLPFLYQLLGTAAVALWLGGFVAALWRSRPRPDRQSDLAPA